MYWLKVMRRRKRAEPLTTKRLSKEASFLSAVVLDTDVAQATGWDLILDSTSPRVVAAARRTLPELGWRVLRSGATLALPKS